MRTLDRLKILSFQHAEQYFISSTALRFDIVCTKGKFGMLYTNKRHIHTTTFSCMYSKSEMSYKWGRLLQFYVLLKLHTWLGMKTIHEEDMKAWITKRKHWQQKHCSVDVVFVRGLTKLPAIYMILICWQKGQLFTLSCWYVRVKSASHTSRKHILDSPE